MYPWKCYSAKACGAEQTTETNNCLIIRSPSLFFNDIFGKPSDLPFLRKSDRMEEKSVVSFTHEQCIICSQTQLDNIAHWRPLFVGSYLQVTWWAVGQWKGRKICIE